jgi:broad specificity phosphatase PhoE
LQTTIFLVRNGETEWAKTRRVLGRRDLSLSDVGQRQAADSAERLAKTEVAEVLSSPLLRAVETAEKIATLHKMEVARDPRLTDFQAGKWEGKRYEEILAEEKFQNFLRDPQSHSIPDGEELGAVRDRVVASIEQALEDNDVGSNIIVVSHAGVVRVLLAHYLGMSLANYHRLRVGSGSISILRFDSDRELPRVLAVNHGGPLDVVLAA